MSTPSPESLESVARRGPHAAGVATLSVPDPENAGRSLATDVWYPAVDGPGEDADHPFGQRHHAREGLAAAPGPSPVLFFSHGSSGMRRQSTFLTTHLASWGFTVIAPDHAGNTFEEMAAITSEDERQRVHLEVRRNRPRDLDTAFDAVLAASGPWPSLDRERIGAFGHSFGGWTALKMPARGRVRAVCGLAPASEAFVGRRAFEPDELPLHDSIPALIVAGIDDVLVDLETSVQPLFDRLAAPRSLVGIEAADHFHFCDGIELLHSMHESNPRENQPRPTKPYEEQLSEERTHRILCALVTHFFRAVLVDGSPRGAIAPDEPELSRLDDALRRLG